MFHPVLDHLSTSAATAYYYRVRAFNAVGDSAYSMTGGATTPSPQLRLEPSGDNLLVTWPLWSAGYQLQAADRLATPVLWTEVQTAAATNNNEIAITLPLASGQRFYRLWRP